MAATSARPVARSARSAPCARNATTAGTYNRPLLRKTGSHAKRHRRCRAPAAAPRRTQAHERPVAGTGEQPEPGARQPALAPERGACARRCAAGAPARRKRSRKEPMKQMEVTIMGQSYLLGCPEGGEIG